MRLIDTHVHLNDPAFAGDLETVLTRAETSGVERMVVVGYDLPSSARAVALSRRYPVIWAAVGVSPHEAGSWRDGMAGEIAVLARDKKVVAVGEIGLDYYYDTAPRQVQQEVFRAQIDLAVELGLPVVVHNREAHADTLRSLGEFADHLPGGVLHCYSGSIETALAAWKMGFLISFAGLVTFKNAVRLRETAGHVPKQAILAETDAPYLTPHPHRGGRNEPALVGLVVAALAETRRMPAEELAEIIWANAERVFRFQK